MQRSSHRIKQDHKRQAEHNKKVHAQKLKVTAARQSLANIIAKQRRVSIANIAINRSGA